MKTFDSPSSEAAMRRLVLARVATGVVVVMAMVFAPPVTDSIMTLESSSLLAERLLDDGEPLPAPGQEGVDVQNTAATPLEPLSTSY